MKMAAIKTVLAFVLGFAIIGAVVATLIAPGFVTWYNTPDEMSEAMCKCVPLVRTATSQLIRAQLFGIAGGGGAGLVLGTLFARSRAVKRRAQAPTPPA